MVWVRWIVNIFRLCQFGTEFKLVIYNNVFQRKEIYKVMLYNHEQLYIHIYICMQKHNDAIKTNRHSSFEKYTSHFIWKGSKDFLKVLLCERWVRDWTELQHIDPHFMAIIAFLSRSPGLLNRGPGGPASLGHCPHSSIFSPTDWTSGAPSYIIIWRPLFFLWASQFRTQFNPSKVKVISWYSSTGCTCCLHRCISYFDSLAGSEVNIQQLLGYTRGPNIGIAFKVLSPGKGIFGIFSQSTSCGVQNAGQTKMRRKLKLHMMREIRSGGIKVPKRSDVSKNKGPHGVHKPSNSIGGVEFDG